MSRSTNVTPEQSRAMFPVLITDRTFLHVHPATAAWWAQREQCRGCAAHALWRESGFIHDSERCTAVRAESPGRWPGSRDAYCIDARLPGASCGPGAALFTPKGSA
jgi:hypothetical protein